MIFFLKALNVVLRADPEKGSFNGDKLTVRSQDVLDIDSDKKNPLLCTMYAPDIYKNLRVAEVCFTISISLLHHWRH